MSVQTNLERIRERVSVSAQSVGRTPDEIKIIAVSKRQPFERVEEVYRLGVRDFGESTAQGLLAQIREFDEAGLRGVRWHFVGSLQRKKVRAVAPVVYRVHSLDRLELAESLSRRADAKGVDALIQVNLGQEAQKGGVELENLFEFAAKTRTLPGLRIRGLMGMPPVGVDSTPFYRKLGTLFGQLGREMQPGVFTELSMGMSGDFETAIRYGASYVRIGTAIFGERTRRSE